MAIKKHNRSSSETEKVMSELPKKFKIIACIFCGGLAERKFDKRKRPYVKCTFCNTMLFLPNRVAEVGHLIHLDLVTRDLGGFRRLLESKLVDLEVERRKGYMPKTDRNLLEDKLEREIEKYIEESDSCEIV